MTTAEHFGGDRPIGAGQDQLGYEEPARHVAKAILQFSSPEGFVLGLEGAWGSGKSSFVNLIIAALRAGPIAPEIAKFSPWLISSRAGLLDELFREIATAAERIELRDERAQTKKRNWLQKQWSKLADRSAARRRLSNHLRRFSSHLSRIGPLADIAGLFIPGASAASKAFEKTGAAAATWGLSASLEVEKEKIVRELRRLTRQIVIFIDDLDRLEPAEAAEVVRLVRAVADFPNVVYVLCYSRSILTRSLKKAFRIKDGAAYIEKIVQVTFSVPKPEDFDLRRMFRRELEAIFPVIQQAASSVEARQRQQRLASVIDIEGGRTLNTPRDVIRALNAMRLYAGPVSDRVDFPDIVWLQLTRIRNSALYEWVESYINSVAVVSGGARVAEGDVRAMEDKLLEALSRDGGDLRNRINELGRVLPGITLSTSRQGADETRPTLFHNVHMRGKLASYITDKRLGSPQHFRFYFALSMPSGALADGDFESFIALAERDPIEAARSFAEMAARERPQGGIVAESVLARLDADAISSMPHGALAGIIRSLAESMDIAANIVGHGTWGRFWIWDTADQVLKTALQLLEPAERTSIIESMFRDGAALGWLTSVMRDETFAHGRFGARPKPEEERLFTDDELDLVFSEMRRRYRDSDPALLLRAPNFLSLLFGWQQAGTDTDPEIRAWIDAVIVTDDGLLRFLDAVRSWVAVNGTVTYPIKPDELGHFVDYPVIRARIESLASADNPAVRERAEAILRAMHNGDDL